LKRPYRWNVDHIRRFMLIFGPISSLFDFLTFFVLLYVFSASAPLFQTGWFIESLATQALVIFAIRTRRVPFWKSAPGKWVLLSTLAVVALGIAIPLTVFGPAFGFVALPLLFYPLLAGMILAYLALVETVKYAYYRMWPKD
jgi:Mg2+-importing ATPase